MLDAEVWTRLPPGCVRPLQPYSRAFTSRVACVDRFSAG